MEVRGSSQDLVLSIHHVDSEHQTQVIRHGSKHLYPVSHLGSPGLELLAFLTPIY